MIRTYLINKSELENIKYSPDIFCESRRHKIEKLKREDDKQLSACVELLLIYALRQQLTDVALPLEMAEDENSKLQLTNIPLFFNLSHASDYAVCSVSDQPIGVDIEYFRVKDLLNPDKILHPDEATVLAFITNPMEKKKFFYECWVGKESYLKNLGIGLIIRPSAFAVKENSLKIGDEEIPETRGHHSIKLSKTNSALVSDKGDNVLEKNISLLERRYVHVFEPGEIRGTDWKFDSGYRMAVCSMEKDSDSIARLIHAEDINSVL